MTYRHHELLIIETVQLLEQTRRTRGRKVTHAGLKYAECIYYLACGRVDFSLSLSSGTLRTGVRAYGSIRKSLRIMEALPMAAS